MFRLLLLLLISFGILQAAQAPESFLDEGADRFSPRKALPQQKPYTSIQIDNEKTPLLQNTKTKKSPRCSFCLCVCGSIVVFGLAIAYGSGFLEGWSIYGG